MPAFGQWTEVATIGDLLVRGARLHPGRNALVMPDASCTYSQLLDGAVRFARSLAALGVKRNDHVGMLALNSVDFLEALFGIQLLGCVAVPINARHKASELGYIIDNAELVAVLTTSEANGYVDFSEVIRTALPSIAKARDPLQLQLTEARRLRCAVLLCGEGRPGFLGRVEFDQLAAAVDADVVDEARKRVRLRDIAVIMYTSGTTANPKGCMLTHEAMTRGPSERARERLAIGNHSVTWGAGPLFHIGSLGPFIGSLSVAGTYLTDTYFEPGRALDLMMREHVTAAWPWFPAIVQGLLDHPTFDAQRFAALKTMLVICPPVLMQRLQALFPHTEMLQACGMTETAGIFAYSGPDETDEQRATTQGRRVPGIEVRIVDPDTGADAPPGKVGEILVRGYCVMEGYYRDAQKTVEALDADGWLHTGDLYLRAEDGSLVFNGRLKDMLKVGGENVAAIEVEAFLCEHPAVRLAEIVGKPDPRLDEVPVAFVELRPGMQLQAEELIAFCKGRISNYKIPREVYFLRADEWPMSATKVNKRALRARLT